MTDGSIRRARWPLIGWLIAVAVVVTMAVANAHLVYVAVASQPDCVAHRKEAGTQEGEYRAAQPVC